MPIGMNPIGGASPKMVWSKEWARDNAVPIGMNPIGGGPAQDGVVERMGRGPV